MSPARALYVAEPLPRWLQREPVVVDCSLLVAALWGEVKGEEAAASLVGKSLHAPHLLVYEVANVARSKILAGAPEADARAGLEAFAEQRIALHRSEPRPVWEVAGRYGLSAYDAAYLVLAHELGAPLLTFDRKLAAAAARHLGAGH